MNAFVTYNLWTGLSLRSGAGSCLEIMHANKPCIVVINDSLMGNHQIELADKLSSLGHVQHTVPR